MATISVSRCAGGNHIVLTVTETWGTHLIHASAQDIMAAAKLRGDSDLLEDVKKVVKQSGASTPNQIKSAIEGATYTDTDNNPAARDVG